MQQGIPAEDVFPGIKENVTAALRINDFTYIFFVSSSCNVDILHLQNELFMYVGFDLYEIQTSAETVSVPGAGTGFCGVPW